MPTNTEKNDDDRLVKITNPDVSVTLPVLKYGYRTTKATWEDLIQFLEVEKDIFKISRSKTQQHEYEVFRHHVKQQYSSTLDYVLISLFGFDAIPSDQNDGKRKAHPSLKDVKTAKILLAENEYPYCIADNVVHYVLWKLKEPIQPNEVLEAREELLSGKTKTKAKIVEILQWVNPPNLKSVPEIDHVHLLCKVE